MTTLRTVMVIIAVGVVLGLLAIPISAYVLLGANLVADSLSSDADASVITAPVRLYVFSPMSMLIPALIVLLPFGAFGAAYNGWHALFIGLVGAGSIVAIAVIGEVGIGLTLVLEVIALVLFALLAFRIGRLFRRPSRPLHT